jgi:hypothetical protein
MLGLSIVEDPKLGLLRSTLAGQSPVKDRDKQKIASSLSSSCLQFMERSILISKTPPILIYFTRDVLNLVSCFWGLVQEGLQFVIIIVAK